MKEIIVLFSMIFCHIADDFYLQGIMKEMKQKAWWEKQTDKELYKNDYLVALFLHAFSWTCMIHIPLVLPMVLSRTYCEPHLFFLFFLINWGIHSFVDNEKANKTSINLITDQSIHVLQIIITWLVYTFLL